MIFVQYKNSLISLQYISDFLVIGKEVRIVGGINNKIFATILLKSGEMAKTILHQLSQHLSEENGVIDLDEMVNRLNI